METMDGNKTAERIRKRDESVILVFFSGMVSLTGEQPVSYTHLDVYKRQYELH